MEFKIEKPGTYEIPTDALFEGVRIVLADGLHVLEDANRPGELIVRQSIEELREISKKWESEGAYPVIR